MFRLRTVQKKHRGEKTEIEIQYRIVHVAFPPLHTIPHLQRNFDLTLESQIEKLNACVGYAVQMAILFSTYLDVILPLPLVFKGSKSFCRVDLSSQAEQQYL